jgi:hypothetical protein
MLRLDSRQPRSAVQARPPTRSSPKPPQAQPQATVRVHTEPPHLHLLPLLDMAPMQRHRLAQATHTEA